jgi:ProP effector
MDKARENLCALAALFPSLFVVEGWGRSKPLKVGIDEDIVALGVLAQAEVNAALGWYTRRVMYLQACTVGSPRYDLNGNPDGVVTEDQAASSAGSLKAILAKRDRKAGELRTAWHEAAEARREVKRAAGREREAADHGEKSAEAWKVAIEKAKEQRVAKEAKAVAKQLEKATAKEAAKKAAEEAAKVAEVSAQKVAAPKVGDGLSALRAAAAKRKAEEIFRVAS